MQVTNRLGLELRVPAFGVPPSGGGGADGAGHGCVNAELRTGRAAALWAALLLAFLQPLAAQEGLENLVGTAGTTIQDGAGRQWAYLLWQGTSPGLVLGRTYAIYAKPGDASSLAPFERVSIVAQQSDTRNIEPLLRRAENVGENPVKLEEDLHSVFEALMPAGSISRAEKLSAAIRGSLDNEEHFQNLLLMARLHPGVALALGVAYADVITGLTTYEVRLFDPAQERDLAVIGRVTLSPGAATDLPAPGAPVEFVDSTAQGDVNVKLRWAAPDPLRRLGLLHYGFNVWRVTRAYAEAPTNNWHVTPPASALLATRALQQPAQVKRCNNLPILTDKDFSAADVANFNPPPAGDPETFFYSDDDGRFRPGYVNLGFTNGARFYYFVTARDILGRDGLVSPGTLLTVCDRMPPLPPDKLKVENDYAFTGGSPKQFLRVTWNQISNTVDTVTNYWVYRWTNIAQIQANASNPSNNLIAIVRHTNNVATASFLDNGPGAPSVAADLGRTYWYTVRAQDLGACGPNLSGNSAPAFGVLRDREGPAAPTGFIDVYCVEPAISLVGSNRLDRGGTPGRFQFRFETLRTSARISWVGFLTQIYDTQSGFVETLNSGFLFYSPGEQTRTYSFELGSTNTGRVLFIYPFAATLDGKFTPVPAPIPFFLSESFLGDLWELDFEAGLRGQRTRLSDNCRQHTPVPPFGGSKTNIIITGTPSPGSKEWRIYRRVDDGPMTLICHGAVGGGSFTCEDDGLPPNGATICYYLQVLDEHGNPSPMVKLGCVDSAPHAPPPAPLLSPLLATGVTNNPGMTITWFAPPPGIERFQVWIAGKPLGVNSNLAPGFLTLQLPNPVPQTLVLNGQTNTYDFYLFLTPRVGPGFGPGPQFAVPAGIELGNTYTVFVKAVAQDGTVGEMSNIEQFVWNPANTNFALCTIPWPARGLPAMNTNLPLGLGASYVQSQNANFTGAVVSVGFKLLTSSGAVSVSGRPQTINSNIAPMSLLFTNGEGDPIFPLALYRFQVTNAAFPKVSGDVIQVTPLMENISYQITNYTINLGGTSLHVTNSILRDSYIVYDRVVITDNLVFFFMYLQDTQPVISGARYRYLLVRFRKNGEIAEVLPTNEMEVP